MTPTQKSAKSSLLWVVATLAVSLPAYSQDGSDSDDEKSVDEIIVTGELRDRSI